MSYVIKTFFPFLLPAYEYRTFLAFCTERFVFIKEQLEVKCIHEEDNGWQFECVQSFSVKPENRCCKP